MIQFALFLIALFLIVCVLYGISAGVQTIAHSAARLTKGQTPQKAAPRAAPALSPAQRCLGQLRELHGLYQNGALSQEEYEQFKRYLLSSIAPVADTDRPDAA